MMLSKNQKLKSTITTFSLIFIFLLLFSSCCKDTVVFKKCRNTTTIKMDSLIRNQLVKDWIEYIEKNNLTSQRIPKAKKISYYSSMENDNNIGQPNSFKTVEGWCIHERFCPENRIIIDEECETGDCDDMYKYFKEVLFADPPPSPMPLDKGQIFFFGGVDKLEIFNTTITDFNNNMIASFKGNRKDGFTVVRNGGASEFPANYNLNVEIGTSRENTIEVRMGFKNK